MVEWVTEFFQDNVWRAVSDDDSLDILFQAILELENM